MLPVETTELVVAEAQSFGRPALVALPRERVEHDLLDGTVAGPIHGPLRRPPRRSTRSSGSISGARYRDLILIAAALLSYENDRPVTGTSTIIIQMAYAISPRHTKWKRFSGPTTAA